MTYTIRNAGAKIYDYDIQRMEKLLNVQLPDDYKSFLIRNNGGRPVPKYFLIGDPKNRRVGQVLDFFGIDDPVESCRLDWNYHVFSERMPNGFFPIACEDGGNIICLAIDSGRFGSVYYWDHNGETATRDMESVSKLSTTFNQFMENLFFAD